LLQASVASPSAPQVDVEGGSFCAVPHTFFFYNVPTTTPLGNTLLAGHASIGQKMAFLNLDSKWFQCYSRAVLEDDLRLRRIYVKDALNMISEALSRQGLEENEREAISVAAHELHLMERERLHQRAS
jgi:hypothetical protein